jgi:ATP phosphoribosyltransferase
MTLRPNTPRGFRDTLFAEASERRALVASMEAVFDSWGYLPVDTPAVEECATLEAGAGAPLQGIAFRLIDSDGTLLALRPEMTLPVARVVATRLSGEPGPFRIRYAAEVYREQASLRGEARQFTQVGIELVGAGGARSDAEVVSLMAGALDAAGLAGYSIGIGTVEVLRALMDASGGDADWRREVLAAAHRGDLVEVGSLTGRAGIDPAAGAALRALPRIQGGAKAIGRCRELLTPLGCESAIAELEQTWALLEATGMADRVRVDFGILRSFDYYTGLIIEAYAPGLGLPLGGGGRYDDVLAAFGAPMPAAGFALSLERVMIALQERDAVPAVPPLGAVIGGSDAAALMRAAARVRLRGGSVRLAAGTDGPAVAAEALRAGAAEALLVDGDRVLHLGPDGSPLGEVAE